MFSGGDPQRLVNWLCDNYGLQTILQSVAQYRPSGPAAEEAPTKRAYKKRGSKKRASKKGAGKRAAKKGGRKQSDSESETS
jgi:hypothetical protein